MSHSDLGCQTLPKAKTADDARSTDYPIVFLVSDLMCLIRCVRVAANWVENEISNLEECSSWEIRNLISFPFDILALLFAKCMFVGLRSAHVTCILQRAQRSGIRKSGTLRCLTSCPLKFSIFHLMLTMSLYSQFISIYNILY